MENLDRAYLARCLARCLAYAAVGKMETAETQARLLITALRSAGILKGSA